MTRRAPIVIPGNAANDAPTYRYWGSQKPPKNAAVLCALNPRVATEDPTKATLRIYGPIDQWGGYWGTSAKDVAKALDDLGDDVTEIQLRVNSGGGSVFEGLAILNLLRAHPAKVTAVVDGIAASAASYIVAGCDTRVMSPGTQMMIHDPWSSAWGCDAAEMRKAAEILDKIGQALAELYADVAGGTADAWRALMLEETWYTASEAVTAGLADEVAVVTNLGDTSTAGDDEAPDLDDDELLDHLDLSIFNHAGRENAPAPKPPSASAVGSPNTEGGSAVALSNEQITMRQKLGIAEDADDATVLAALEEALDERADDTAAAATTTTKVPEGMTLVETEVLDDLRQGAAAGRSAREQLDTQDRDTTIAAAIAAGKTTPARQEHWEKSWDADAEGTRAMLDALAPGLAVPTGELGHGSEPSDETSTITDAALDEFAAQLGLNKEALRG